MGRDEGSVGGVEVLPRRMSVVRQLLQRCALMLVAMGHASGTDVCLQVDW